MPTAITVRRNGVDYNVEVANPDDPEEAYQKAIEAEQAEMPNRSTGERVARDAKSVATGVRETAEGTVGLPGDLPGIAGDMTRWTGRQISKIPFADDVGVTKENIESTAQDAQSAMDKLTMAGSGQYGLGFIIKKALEQAGLLSPEDAAYTKNALPTTQDVHGAVSDVLPEPVDEATSYEPTNYEEKGFRLLGNFAPGAGGKIKRAEEGAGVVGALLQRLKNRVAAPAATTLGAEKGTDVLVEKGIIDPDTATAIKMLAGGLGGMGGAMMEKSAAVRQAASLVNRNPKAIRTVYDAIRADGYDDVSAKARLDQMGLDSRLVDLGPTTQDTAAQAVRAPTEGRRTMIDMLEDRATREPRVVEQVRRDAGLPEVNKDVVAEDRQTRLTKEEAEYEPAHARQAAPVDAQGMIDEIDTLLGGEKSPKKRQHLEDIKKSLYIQDRHGTVTGTVDPSSSGLLSARKALRDKLYDVHGNKRSDLGPEEAGMLQDMYTRINQEMDVANPDIRAVDKKVSGIKEEGRKFEEGADVLKRGEESISGGEFEGRWNKMKPEEQESIKQGMSRWIDSQVDMTTADRTRLKSIVGTTWNKQKLEKVLGPENTNKLLEGLDTIDRQRDSLNIVARNKPANIERPEGSVTEGAGTAGLVTGGMTGSVSAGVGAAAVTTARNALRNNLAKSMASDAVKSDVASMLASGKPEDILRAAAKLRGADAKSVVAPGILSALIARNSGGPR